MSAELEAATAWLRAEPAGDDVLARLSAVVDLVPGEIARDHREEALRAVCLVIDLEHALPPESPARGSYRIALGRLLTRNTIELAAWFLRDVRYREQAELVLYRSGAEGSSVLFGLLADAPDMAVRRMYFDMLRKMPEGARFLIHELSRTEWFAVRSAADLIGELRLEPAVPALGKAAAHPDSRVRKSALVALCRIGKPSGMAFLQRALKDPDPDVRLVVVRSVEGEVWGPLAMPFAAAASAEPDPARQADYYRALGRIGTPEAIGALKKAAEPGGRILGRKPAGPRIAAVNGLRAAGGPAAIAALRELAADRDPAVRESALRALEHASGEG